MIIPYDANNPISYIKIDNQGVKTSFITVPTADLTQQIANIPLCKKENESVDIINNKCCSGLIPSSQEDDLYICVNCGDKICSQYESYNSCPIDCVNLAVIATDNLNLNAPQDQNLFFQDFFKYPNIFIIVGTLVFIILIVIIIIILVILRKRRKNKELPPQIPQV